MQTAGYDDAQPNQPERERRAWPPAGGGDVNAAAGPAPETALAFGPFVLHRARKLLLQNGQAVRLGSRAFDLLAALVERAGKVVSRTELEACVWPRSVVEETSLRVHMSALRKVLGEGQEGVRYIANVPGRGYSFVAEVVALDAGQSGPASPAADVPHNLPTRLTREIGRQAMVGDVAARLAQSRMVSIVGPGGMGKTTVALAVAEEVLPRYRDGVRFVDLAPLADPDHVPDALASALGLALAPGAGLDPLCQHLRGQRILIVLDNCEHVIDAAAELVERLLGAAPELRVLATSREPLAVSGEWVCRLGGLDAPAPGAAVTLELALAYPAVQLFVERSLANADAGLMSDANCAVITHLCRRLDGMPLAIELAAGCMDSLGPQGLAERLDQLFDLLTRGRRCALPRQRTLQALLDWSHRLLSEPERIVLRRLSVFRAGFSVAAAVAVASCARVSPVEVVECLIGLSAKSLVGQEARGAEIRNRLLYTTRTYAEARLADSGERAAVARRHAEYMCELLERSSEPTGGSEPPPWSARHGHLMDDVRAAMDWADGRNGDAALGGALAVAAILPIFGHGRLDEFRRRIEQAIGATAALESPQPERELALYTAMSLLMSQTVTDDDARARVAARTIALAALQEGTVPRVRALYGTCLGAYGQGAYPAAFDYARRIRLLLHADADAAVLLGDRLLSMNLHCLGRHAEARELATRVLDYPATRLPAEYDSPVSRAVSMRIILARMLWLAGQAREAERLVAEALATADDEPGLSQVLLLGQAALPIAIWQGEHARARLLAARLAELSRHHALNYWESWAGAYRAVLERRAGGEVAAPTNSKELDMLCTMDERYVGAAALARCERGDVGWCAPEVLRRHGENLLRDDAPGAAAAAAGLFERAWDMAGAQQALAWQLRAACSAARLALSERAGAPAPAAALARLEAVRARFTDGRDSADLAEARRLLAAP